MSDARRLDVAIVGGGPAGATCARHLAQAGVAVRVLDRERPPRYKTCGGGVVARARRMLEVDLAPVAEHETHAVQLNLVQAGLSFEVRRPDPLVTMTMRADLDACLLEAATRAGAELDSGFDVVGLTQSNEAVELQSRDGRTVTATHVVAADGALSATARAAGWPTAAGGIPALEAEVRVDRASFERLATVTRFDFEVVPDGYAWVFPKRDHLSLGVLSTGAHRRGLRRVLERYIARLGIERIAEREDHGFVIPIRPRPGGLVRGRVLLVGDAAGLADPLTGEGISHAAASGIAAAGSIAAHLGDAKEVAAAYAGRLEREVLCELRAARRLAHLLYRHPRLRRVGFVRVGQTLCEGVAGVIEGTRSYRGLLMRPRTYARLLTAVARGAGAGTPPRRPPAGSRV